MTIRGELARVTGLPRPDAGRGNRALVAEGYATMLSPGFYELTERPQASSLPESAEPGRGGRGRVDQERFRCLSRKSITVFHEGTNGAGGVTAQPAAAVDRIVAA